MKNIFIFCVCIILLSPVTYSQIDTCDNQMPGDLNSDGSIDVSDLTFFINFLTGYGPAPDNFSNADINGDCIIDFSDETYLESFLFSGGPPPVECTCINPDTCTFQFIGDVDNNGFLDITDIIYLIDFVNGTGPNPPVLANADANGDCVITIADATVIQLFISGGGTIVDCTCISPNIDCLLQKPGDFNSDGFFDISDLTYFSNYFYNNGSPPNPLANADANGDCIINVGDSKLINNFLFKGGPPPVDCTCDNPAFMTVCCVDSTGNIDYDPADEVNIADVVAMVAFMFENPSVPLLCEEEANVDGLGWIDIADLVYLVDYAFGDPTGPIPVVCQ